MVYGLWMAFEGLVTVRGRGFARETMSDDDYGYGIHDLAQGAEV
jgi:hypothetical protein